MAYLVGLVLLLSGFLFWYIPWLSRKQHEHVRWLNALRASYREAFIAPPYDYTSHMEQTERLLRQNVRLAEALAAPPLPSPEPAQARVQPPPPPPPPAPAPAPAPAPPPPPPPHYTVTSPVTLRVPTLDLSVLERRPATKPSIPAPTGAPTFERGEPEHLGEFESQGVIVSYLAATIQALEPHRAAVAPLVFTGPAGTGKTALMKAFANSLRLRNLQMGLGETDYLELFPADISDRDDLERMLKRASVRPAVLRIDELHTIDREHAVLLYELLACGAYRFANDASLTPMTHLTVIAATTDWALLHEALRRRFEHFAFEPLTSEEIAAAVRRRPFAIAEPALQELVKRTSHSGVLWEALRYYKQGETFARSVGHLTITDSHMEQVYQLNALDSFGLTALDRRVINVMLRMPRTRRARDGSDELVAYGGAEVHISQVAQVDLGTFRQIVKPKLLARELLSTRAGYGQVLTERAIQLYRDTCTPV
jgi:Holliday junction resolvasome RuvABC ATP-dependent DNA helicase subunit